jgi:23S rRNA (cytosine1962-C5)-methyltransferase
MDYSYPKVQLKKGKEASILRKHLWIFSGALQKIDSNLEEGAIVRVYNHNNEYLATGIYSSLGSISIRIISFVDCEIDIHFFIGKLEQAKQKRASIQQSNTNTYRWFHGEGDEIPSLIIDGYNDIFVFQAHSLGIHKLRKVITEALIHVFKPNAIYYKSESTLNKKVENEWLYNPNQSEGETEVLENGHRFIVNWVEGQKTGFFIDQKDNRYLMSQLQGIKSVLNTFCYTGGFSVSAPKFELERVVSVDSSKVAIALCEKNMALNNLDSIHTAHCQDVFEFLTMNKENFDLVVLDPPAFAKHMDARHRAVQAYKRLNVNALNQINSGGLLFTFSCSQVVDKQLFRNTITAAAIESGRSVRLLHQLSQPADHPVSLFHPEGEYLKGLVLQVD